MGKKQLKQVRIGRIAHFSCGHSYKLEGISPAQASQWWGELYVPGGWGHNFVVEATLLVEVPGRSGLSFSLPGLDEALAKVCDHLDHTYLNTDVEYFKNRVPSLENITLYVFSLLKENLKNLESVRLMEDEDRWAFTQGGGQVTLTERFKVSALHRHHNPDLTEAENQNLYTKCATLHGHQYLCEVGFEGPVQDPSGLVVRREDFRQRVQRTIVEPFAGQILNDIIGNTSGELLYREFETRLKGEFGSHFGGLLLRETRKNHFQGAQGEVSGRW